MAMSKIKALQIWCKRTLEGYRDVNITDMTTSWRNGLAFCAMIHKYRPDLIDYDSLDKENVYENNKLAFDVAENELNITALLEAADMVAMKVPDRLSVITYVAQYHNYFKDQPILGGPGISVANKSSTPSGGVKRHHEGAEPTSRPEVKRFTPAHENKQDRAQDKQKPSRVASMGETCQICRDKVYLLERHIEDGKLYHRSCYRHSDMSPTSKVYARPSILSNRDEKNDKDVKGMTALGKGFANPVRDRSPERKTPRVTLNMDTPRSKHVHHKIQSNGIHKRETENNTKSVIDKFENKGSSDIKNKRSKSPDRVHKIHSSSKERLNDLPNLNEHTETKATSKWPPVDDPSKSKSSVDISVKSTPVPRPRQSLLKDNLKSELGTKQDDEKMEIDDTPPTSSRSPHSYSPVDDIKQHKQPEPRKLPLVLQTDREEKNKESGHAETKHHHPPDATPKQRLFLKKNEKKLHGSTEKLNKSVAERIQESKERRKLKQEQANISSKSPRTPTPSEESPPPLPRTTPPELRNSSPLKSPSPLERPESPELHKPTPLKPTSHRPVSPEETKSSRSHSPVSLLTKTKSPEETKSSRSHSPVSLLTKTKSPEETKSSRSHSPVSLLTKTKSPEETKSSRSHSPVSLLTKTKSPEETKSSRSHSPVSLLTKTKSPEETKSSRSHSPVSLLSKTKAPRENKHPRSQSPPQRSKSPQIQKPFALKSDEKKISRSKSPSPRPEESKVSHSPVSHFVKSPAEKESLPPLNSTTSPSSPPPRPPRIQIPDPVHTPSAAPRAGPPKPPRGPDHNVKPASSEHIDEIKQAQEWGPGSEPVAVMVYPGNQSPEEKDQQVLGGLLKSLANVRQRQPDSPTSDDDKFTSSSKNNLSDLQKSSLQNKHDSNVLNNLKNSHSKGLGNVSRHKPVEKSNSAEYPDTTPIPAWQKEVARRKAEKDSKDKSRPKSSTSILDYRQGKDLQISSPSVTGKSENTVTDTTPTPSWQKEVKRNKNSPKRPPRPKSLEVLSDGEGGLEIGEDNLRVLNLKKEKKSRENKRGKTSLPVESEVPDWQKEAQKRMEARKGNYVDPEKRKVQPEKIETEKTDKTLSKVSNTKEPVVEQHVNNKITNRKKIEINGDHNVDNTQKNKIQRNKVENHTKKTIHTAEKHELDSVGNQKRDRHVKNSVQETKTVTKPQKLKVSPGVKFNFDDNSSLEGSLEPSPREHKVNKGRQPPPRPKSPPPVNRALKQNRMTPNRHTPPRIGLSPGKLTPMQIQRQLMDIDTKLTDLELKGRDLEDSIRNAQEDEEDVLMIDWFVLVSQKNELVRQEADLIYAARENELEDEQESVQDQLRQLLDKPNKTKEDKQEEEYLLGKLLDIVDQRSKIVDSIDDDKHRYEEEDKEIATVLEKKAFTVDGFAVVSS